MKKALLISCSAIVAVSAASMVAAQAPTTTYRCNAYLDTDNNTSTGGDVQVIQAGDPGPQTISGVDVIVNATADLPLDPTQWGTVSGAVTGVDVLRWNEGLADFVPVSQEIVNYPTGPGNGLDGHHVIEFIAPLDEISPSVGPMSVVYHISGVALNDYTSLFLYRPQGLPGVPAVTAYGAALLGVLLAAGGLLMLRRFRAAGVGAVTMGLVILVTGIAWAATISPDGNVGDWAGISPSVSDPIGDSNADDANEDIVYGFVTNDDVMMGFRIDVLNVAVTDPYSTTPIPTPSATPGPS